MSKTLQWGVWGSLAAVMALVFVAYLRSPSRVTSSESLPVLGEVGEFALTNQLGSVRTRSDYLGHVWVADIIFTRCAGPCPEMTRKMALLQSDLSGNPGVRFVTLTTDAEFDTPEVLRRYGEKFGADPGRWDFLTGNPEAIARLATHGLRLTAVEKEEALREGPVDLFIHSTIFVVIDKRGRLRAAFETGGEGVDFTVVQASIREAVQQLSGE